MSPAASGVGRTKSVQRVVDLHLQCVGPHRQHVACYDSVAAGQRDEQWRGTGANRLCAVVGNVASAIVGFGDPRLHRQLSRSDVVGAVSRADRCDDRAPPRVVAGDAARVIPNGGGQQ
jgi:hypothetical protein